MSMIFPTVHNVCLSGSVSRQPCKQSIGHVTPQLAGFYIDLCSLIVLHHQSIHQSSSKHTERLLPRGNSCCSSAADQAAPTHSSFSHIGVFWGHQQSIFPENLFSGHCLVRSPDFGIFFVEL